jgi:hypothetical protein
MGARWWHEGTAEVSRRQAVFGLLTLPAIMTAACGQARSPTAPELTFEVRNAFEMQRAYGWDFGARGEALVFDGESTQAFDRSALTRLSDDLGPSDPRNRPYYDPTLFESPTALPTSAAVDDAESGGVQPLSEVLVPIFTPEMDDAFRAGKALATLLDPATIAAPLALRAVNMIVIVDLPGPEAVAFAAGASEVLDPVFIFGNWPHPFGVVASHLTLAAAAYYQPLFTRTRAVRAARATSTHPHAQPMFVLDRWRLAPYVDDATEFDNRYMAKVPSADALVARGTKDVLYICLSPDDRRELPDLMDDFLAYVGEQLTLHLVPVIAFHRDLDPAEIDDGVVYYGGKKVEHPTFWTDWPTPSDPSQDQEDVRLYIPIGEATDYSFGLPYGGGARRRPAGFGTIPVAIELETGAVVGTRANIIRSGTWNRTSGWGGG